MTQNQDITTLRVQEKHGRILRGPLQVAFDLTNRCNFRCLHCYNLSGDCYVINEELDDDEVIKFAKELADMKPFNVCFCGGGTFVKKRIIIQSSRDIIKSR